MIKKNMVRITVTLEKNVLKKIEREALKKNITKSGFINIAIDDYFAAYDFKSTRDNQLTQDIRQIVSALKKRNNFF
jgi:metal-responsive CopG/Arc/MetJ family transcriptional regulator